MLIVMGDLRCGILLDVKTRARAVLATASGTHFVHDGFSDILYVLLPIWAQEFRLNLAQVGLIRTAYTAAMASFQIPAGLLAERWGERRLLAAGTALTACGFIAAGAWAEGFASLLVLLLTAGLATGGAAAPPMRAPGYEGNGWGIRDARGFQALSAIGMIDNATRTGLLTFLPFALIAKGSTVAGVGSALALLFAGGAIGKFVCGLVAEKVGVIRTVVLTETATAGGIALVVLVPLPVALAILLPLGIALNGTSSVLYATVADLVTVDRRSRAYGLYYTLSVGASSSAPTVYGLLGDAVGVGTTLMIVALVVLVTIPLCLALRASIAEPARA